MHIWPLNDRPPVEKYKIDYRTPEAAQYLAQSLCNYLCTNYKNKASPLVIIPIGTDRSTGDALGPLVGTFLQDNLKYFHCIGTLDDPVHAANLENTLHILKTDYPSAFTIAVDACLGELNAIGTVNFGSGPIRPGAGVHKNLPPVGDCHFTAIVNVGGYMEYLVLQNTRLSCVMGMAKVIAEAIKIGVDAFYQQNNSCYTLNS